MISANIFSRMIKLSVVTLSLLVLASCASSPSREVAGSSNDDYKTVEKTHNKRFIKGDNF
jgi:hypothetical protein